MTTAGSTASARGSRATSPSLLADLRADRAEAWERLVRLYSPFVLRCCRRAGLSGEDATDAFQEVFGAVARRIETFSERDRPGGFRAWLRTIAVNKARDLWRRREREPRAVGGTEIHVRLSLAPAPEPRPEGEGPPTQAEMDALVLREALEEVSGQFRERTWRAFVGTAVDGRPARDVGEELGMSPGAVRVARSRVLRRLREELGELFG